MAAWKSAEAFPDVAPGIRALRAAGVQVRGCAQHSKDLRWALQNLESKSHLSHLNPPRLPCKALSLIWHWLMCAP